MRPEASPSTGSKVRDSGLEEGDRGQGLGAKGLRGCSGGPDGCVGAEAGLDEDEIKYF